MFFLSYSLFLSGQNTQNLRSDSPTFNEFRHHSASLDQVQAYAKTIYPRGKIILDPENSASLEFDDIPDLLSADPGSSFELISESTSKLNPDRIFYKYQQFHQGVKVDNGGYTVLAAPPGAVGGCEQSGLFGISPAIATGININTTATISQQEAAAIIGNNVINTSEVLIDWGLTEAGDYHLVYKVDYWEDDRPYRAWIDANNGSILREAEISMDLNATTFTYGEQNLNDTPLLDGGTRLETGNGILDGVLKTYDFPDNLTPFFGPNYTEDLIPITDNEQSWDDPSIRIAVWQGHFCATNVIPVFNELIDGVNEFTDVKLGISTSPNRHSENARVASGSHMGNAMIGIGNTGNGIHLALHDVIAHELAHVFLFDYLTTEEIGPKSLHEGIADMFATYIESIIQNDETIDLGSVPGGLDWVMGDDRPGAKARDLENPQFSTWEEVMNLTEEHDRGEVIGHWFYLISQGSGPGFQVPIPPLGWTVQGAGSGNSVTGNCLTVLDWPEYAYYPQIFSIRLYNITQEFQLRYNLRMEDCEGDDPDCNDVGVNNFESNNSSSSHYAVERTDSDHLFDKELPIHLKVFDINGRKVYEGKNLDQSFNSDNLEGLLIYCYYDQQGKIIETKKMVIIK